MIAKKRAALRPAQDGTFPQGARNISRGYREIYGSFIHTPFMVGGLP